MSASAAILSSLLATSTPTVLMLPEHFAPSMQPEAIKRLQVSTNCRATIRTVRNANGLPPLAQTPNNIDKPLFLAAVDQRIHGCQVLRMRQNLNDIRPLPEFSDSVLLMRVR